MSAESHDPHVMLVMLSGGLDSTYALYHYLVHTTHRVHAHHVSLRYPHQERWRAEDPACEEIVAWCRRRIRSVEYSSSRFDLDFSRIGWDTDLILAIASKVALNLGSSLVTVSLGWCPEDMQHEPVRDRFNRQVPETLWLALCASVGTDVRINPRLATPLLESGRDKAVAAAELPDELVQLTWSCRYPVFVDGTSKPCGICGACDARSDAIREVELTRRTSAKPPSTTAGRGFAVPD